MELSSHSQSRGAHLETLVGNPVLWHLHLHEKKEQARARRTEREGIQHFTDCFLGFFALTPNFPPYISLLLQPRDLVLSLSFNFYVPVTQKLEML